ncbi:MAG: citrate/2-methylcitrate synthase [Oscillospiraceae bacterium]|nr:citrate/2-methylcitrate synthase [Oscillospiraceae bacterium]
MASHYSFSRVTPQIESLARKCSENGSIDPSLYGKYEVKRGLRDINGKGVLAGLTEISEIVSYVIEDNEMIPCEGKLFYRGYNINDLVAGMDRDNRFGFEEITYLLLFGELPDKTELDKFTALLADYRRLPSAFVRDIMMKSPSNDIMNNIARGVLTLFSYDDHPNDTSIPNVLRQSLELISLMPLLSVYGYQAKKYYKDDDSLIIHKPVTEYSTAENILHILRPDSKFTELEARVLDMALVLHAEHGGGNNSTFTTHVVTSSGTDTYSAIAAALGSLKGPKHGGANVKVSEMFEDIKKNVKDWADEDEVSAYLLRLLRKDAFDRSGLIYGMGHAVYSISDPRANILHSFVDKLAAEKHMEQELELYHLVEKLAPKVISAERHIYKGVSANVDFYSGFVYSMLDLPTELYTPLFAIARIAGWSAHRIEELTNAGKIIRPAYKSVAHHKEYTALSDR